MSDLTARVGLSRRTFYRHFKRIDDLLETILDKKVLYLFTYIKCADPDNFESLCLVFFSFWADEGHFLSFMKNHQLLHLLLMTFTQNSDNSLLSQFFPSPSPYIYAFASGGMWHCLVTWVENSMRESPVELSKIARDVG